MLITNNNNFHFIGIGGIGTSSLAQILNKMGKEISGSDNSKTDLTKSLKKDGIKVYERHSAGNITKKHQVIIYSPAIPATNPELQAAKRLKIPCLSYPEALGELSKEYFTISIAGTHGKSTTTAMTSLILNAAGLDPTVVIGTKLREFKNKNFRVGKSKYLVLEACEYRRSFMHFKPNILIITNIEAEHLDYYKDLKDYQNAFHDLALKVPEDGYIIISDKEKNLGPIIKGCSARIIRWKNKIKTKPGIPGEFNLENATNAAKVGEILGIKEKIVNTAIQKYRGSWRRMDYKKEKMGKTQFIDDYGHHPTEVRVTLNAIREKHPQAKILCIFQPHQHSRTKMFLKEFGHAFNSVDQLLISNIYQVRDSEEVVKSISVDDLLREIKKYQPHAKNGKSLEESAQYIKDNYKKFDIIVTMGAGDISKIYMLIKLSSK